MDLRWLDFFIALISSSDNVNQWMAWSIEYVIEWVIENFEHRFKYLDLEK